MATDSAVAKEPSLPIVEFSARNGKNANRQSQSWWASLEADISMTHADIPIILCCLVSGLCDSSSYNAWSCFVSMQTGNTVFLALGASNQPIAHPYGWLKSLDSIFFFLCGCTFFSQSRRFGAKGKGILAVSFLLQSLCIMISAALVQGHVVAEPTGVITETGDHVQFMDLVPLGFLAFQFGGQIVSSRLLGFNEVPTNVLTSVYCDLASDPAFFERRNIKRNRRIAAVLAILIGAIVGGWISRSRAGLSTTLWIAGGIKLGISIAWSFWQPAVASVPSNK